MKLIFGSNRSNDLYFIADNLITNHVESDVVNKGKVLEACDFFLTPYRKLFYGKTVSAALDSRGVPDVKNDMEIIDHGGEKVLWITLAVVAAPLAAVAAFFKLIIHPTIGTKEKPFTIGNDQFFYTKENFEMAGKAINSLKHMGLDGRVQLYFKLPPNHEKESEISENLIQCIQHSYNVIFTNINVNNDVVRIQCNPLHDVVRLMCSPI